MNTGSQVFGRPSMGSWLTYGLGSESRDLPGFVVLLSGENAPDGGKSCWGSGFLPTVYQGVEFRSKGDPVLFVSNPDGVDTRRPARSLDLVTDLNRVRRAEAGDPEIDTRIASYEMAYRMQSSVPELIDISKRARDDPRAVRHRSRARCRSPTTACWRAGSSSAACASCSSITAAGTRTARASAPTSRRRSRSSAARPIAPRPRSCATSSSAACSTRRSSSGAANSAARR